MASADVRPPQSQLWVAYQPFMELWGRSAPDGNEDIIVSAGHGRPPVFSIAMVGSTLQRLQVRTPGFLDGYRLQAEPAYPPPESRDDAFWEATAEYEGIEGPLVHHRPPITLTLSNGQVRRQWSATEDRYRACVRRLFEEGVERIEAAASTAGERRGAAVYRGYIPRELHSPLPYAGYLIQLMDLQLPPADEDHLLNAARRRIAARPGSEEPTQYSLRDRAMVEHGEEFGREINLLRDRRSAEAEICRSFELREIRSVRTDQCRISAVIDRRDGWPIYASVRREKVSLNGARSGRVDFFSRITPVEGFAAPANPCPTA